MILKIIGERTSNFSARLIHTGMWIWQAVRFRKPEKVYNHWILQKEGFNYEATAHGVEKTVRPFHEDMVEYTIHVSPKSIQYLESQVGKKYEFANFLFHTFMIILPHWLGNKTDKKHSCVELVTRILQQSGYSINTWSNPVELKNWLDVNEQ